MAMDKEEVGRQIHQYLECQREIHDLKRSLRTIDRKFKLASKIFEDRLNAESVLMFLINNKKQLQTRYGGWIMDTLLYDVGQWNKGKKTLSEPRTAIISFKEI